MCWECRRCGTGRWSWSRCWWPTSQAASILRLGSSNNNKISKDARARHQRVNAKNTLTHSHTHTLTHSPRLTLSQMVWKTLPPEKSHSVWMIIEESKWSRANRHETAGLSIDRPSPLIFRAPNASNAQYMRWLDGIVYTPLRASGL
jgi:hypothetical protein